MHPQAGERCEFGPFLIDPSERTLLRGIEPIPLASKSFDVLWMLVRNSGRLLDKDFLLNSIWPDTSVEENSLAKAIAEIRKALSERPGDNRFIATIARRGYRFLPKVTMRPADALLPETGLRMKILAVLPLAWLTHEGSDGPLAVGIADALIARLSNLPQLVVRPTTSILRYQNDNRDAAAIATELHADYLISGSIQQSGERVRVTVQMVCPNEGRSIWADRFEEELTHTFAIEEAISERVAAALALRLTGDQFGTRSRQSTRNNQAWHLYLRGRYHLSKRTLPSAQTAIGCFRQAVEIDAEYAQAWVGIADAYILTGLHGALTGWLAPHETYPEARRAALRAIHINETSAEAHASLGFINFFYDWDPVAADQQFGRSFSLHPHYANAHNWYAMSCAFLGREREAIDAIGRALEIEPLSPLLNANRGYILYFARRYDDSVSQLQTTLEMDASFAPAHHRLGLSYAALGRDADAIGHLERARQLSDDSPQVLAALGYIYGRSGKVAASREILGRLREKSETSYVSAVTFAEVFIGLGQYTDAFDWLDKALNERTSAVLRLSVDPRYDCVRSEPWFEQTVQKVRPLNYSGKAKAT